MQKCFLGCVGVLLLILGCNQLAEAQRRVTTTDAKKFEVSFNWGAAQEMMFRAFPGSSRTANGVLLADTALTVRRQPSFTVTASYQPFSVLHVGVQLTSTPDAQVPESRYPGNASTDDRWYSVGASEVQWGITSFITTPWSNPSSRASWLMYRAKIGGTYDLSGYTIDALVSQSNGSIMEKQLGRMHDHRFSFAVEGGLKNPFGRPGAVFVQLGYAYSLYQFQHDDAPGLRFTPSSRHHVLFGVGISIS